MLRFQASKTYLAKHLEVYIFLSFLGIRVEPICKHNTDSMTLMLSLIGLYSIFVES